MSEEAFAGLKADIEAWRQHDIRRQEAGGGRPPPRRRNTQIASSYSCFLMSAFSAAKASSLMSGDTAV